MARHHALRALITVLTLWVGGRFAVLMWPGTAVAPDRPAAISTQISRAANPRQSAIVRRQPPLIDVRHAAMPVAMPAAALVPLAPRLPVTNATEPRLPGATIAATPPVPAPPDRAMIASAPPPAAVAMAAAVPDRAQSDASAAAVVPPASLVTTGDRTARRYVSGWTLLRPGSQSNALAPAGVLGGSQAGLRLAQPVATIGHRRAVYATLRLSDALINRSGREAAIGLAVGHRGRIVAELGVERRVRLSRGARDAFAVIAVIGVDDVGLGSEVTASTYAQAGVVGPDQPFADGALRIERAVAIVPRARITIGGSVWAAAQPRLARVDVGPVIALRQQIGQAGMRVAAEWRTRVSGTPAPGSGPALSVGIDF